MKEDRFVKNRKFIDDVRDKWIVIFNQLSYSGFNKKRIYQGLNYLFGSKNWLPAHFFDGKIISRYDAYLIYEEAYYQFLKNNPNILEKIVNSASEVYDIAPPNIASGLDYTKQEYEATHLQDISIRRVLTRLELEKRGMRYDPEKLPKIKIFKGNHLVQIRGHTTEGYRLGLNPGKVPFHRPDLIMDTEQEGWWDDGSVEDWYQKNKVLLINPDNFNARLVIISSDGGIFFGLNNQDYYHTEISNGQLDLSLKYMPGKKARRLYSQKENQKFSEVKNSPEHPYTKWREILTGFKPHPSKKRIDFKELKW